jgi:phosphatidylglycerophosphate synthase
MKMMPVDYQWTSKDKWLYFLSLVPFLLVFVGTAVLLSIYSIWLTILLLFFYLLTNVFQAGCCVGCPYRGKYCPALFGVYLGNLLSGILYPNREFDQKFFDRNATAGETMVLVVALFPIYWVYGTGWFLVPIYLLLIAAHLVIFMPTQCDKCSYNETCPGGIAWRACSVWLEKIKTG